MKKLGITLLLSTLCIAVLVACSSTRKSSDSASNKINAVATVGMVADLVRNVGGEHVNVIAICGSGVDPHLYRPTVDDVAEIQSADIVFYCGLMLEGKLASTLEKRGQTKPVLALAETIDASLLISGDEGHGGDASGISGDPHLWNDVSLWSRSVDAIEAELAKLAPEHAETFSENASRYKQELAALHQWGLKVVGTIPKDSRLLITSHDAFNYFGRAYGLDVRGVQGLSTESEAGIQQVVSLVDLLIQRNVKAVFVESSVPAKGVRSLIEGAADRGHSVRLGGTLFSDAMGQEDTYEGTYIGMLDHNLTTVVSALGGQVDSDGFQGKLSGVSE